MPSPLKEYDVKDTQNCCVLIPAEDMWEPIQAIRRKHDRQVRRWMPHVTLLYPFRPRERFDEAAEALRESVRSIAPFEVRLAEFRQFQHGRARYTVWLAPEPQDQFVPLQAALELAVPDCDDVSRHADGFTPHLSVGQIQGHIARADLMANLQAS